MIWTHIERKRTFGSLGPAATDVDVDESFSPYFGYQREFVAVHQAVLNTEDPREFGCAGAAPLPQVMGRGWPVKAKRSLHIGYRSEFVCFSKTVRAHALCPWGPAS